MTKMSFTQRTRCPWCDSQSMQMLCEVSYDESGIQQHLRSFYERQGRFESDLLHGEIFTLVVCQSCQLVFQRDIPDMEFMKKLYSVWIDPVKSYDVYDRYRTFDYYAGRAEGIISIGKLFKSPPWETKIIDYSMGWGQWARIAASLGFQVFGTEFVQEKKEHAVSLGIHVLEEDHIPIQSFDLVHADQVLEHVPDPAATFTKLCELVRPGGFLSIGVPYGDDIRQRLQPLDWSAAGYSPQSLMPVRPLEHINCFNRNLLNKALLDKGFRVVTTERGKILSRIYKNTRRAAGLRLRKLLGKQKPPLTIDFLAQRKE